MIFRGFCSFTFFFDKILIYLIVLTNLTISIVFFQKIFHNYIIYGRIPTSHISRITFKNTTSWIILHIDVRSRGLRG